MLTTEHLLWEFETKGKMYDYDDVMLVPRRGVISSRNSPTLWAYLPTGVSIPLPIMLSPMKGIASAQLTGMVSKLGGIGFVHRFQPYEDMIEAYLHASHLGRHANTGIAVGNNKNFDRLILSTQVNPSIIIIDIANGYTPVARKLTTKAKELKDALVVSGTVCTFEGAEDLVVSGADIIRVGLGSGNLCTTRDVTGVGVHQITAIASCAKVKLKYPNVKIIADGGIRTPGDAVKALAAGADFVMMGTLFSQCEEADHNGLIKGMASKEHQMDTTGSYKSNEGRTQLMEKSTSVEEFLAEFTYGIKSAMTYLNADNLHELKTNARWAIK